MSTRPRLKATAASLEKTAPPISALEALRRNVAYAMFGAAKPADMAEVVLAQLKKAKDGDHKAATFCRDLFLAGLFPKEVPVASHTRTLPVNNGA